MHVDLYSESTKKFTNSKARIMYRMTWHLSYLSKTYSATTRGNVPFFDKVFKYVKFFLW